MGDERKGRLLEQREAGARAEAILRDPVMVEAFDAMEAEILTRWRQTKTTETAEREKAWAMMLLLDNLRAHLAHHVRMGKMAEGDLLELSNSDEPEEGRREVLRGQ